MDEDGFDDGDYRVQVDRPSPRSRGFEWGMEHTAIVFWLCMLLLAVDDMRSRDVPFTWAGIRWWLGMWWDMLKAPWAGLI